RAGLDEFPVDVGDDPGAGEHQQVVATLEVAVPVGITLTAIRGLVEPMLLDHGAHRTVEHDDTFGEQLAKGCDAFGLRCHQPTLRCADRTPSAWQMAKVSSERFSV